MNKKPQKTEKKKKPVDYTSDDELDLDKMLREQEQAVRTRVNERNGNGAPIRQPSESQSSGSKSRHPGSLKSKHTQQSEEYDPRHTIVQFDVQDKKPVHSEQKSHFLGGREAPTWQFVTTASSEPVSTSASRASSPTKARQGSKHHKLPGPHHHHHHGHKSKHNPWEYHTSQPFMMNAQAYGDAPAFFDKDALRGVFYNQPLDHPHETTAAALARSLRARNILHRGDKDRKDSGGSPRDSLPVSPTLQLKKPQQPRLENVMEDDASPSSPSTPQREHAALLSKKLQETKEQKEKAAAQEPSLDGAQAPLDTAESSERAKTADHVKLPEQAEPTDHTAAAKPADHSADTANLPADTTAKPEKKRKNPNLHIKLPPSRLTNFQNFQNVFTPGIRTPLRTQPPTPGSSQGVTARNSPTHNKSRGYFLFRKKPKQRHEREGFGTLGLIRELEYGMLPMQMIRMSLCEVDDKGRNRVPVFLNYLRLHVTPLVGESHHSRLNFRIEFAYGDLVNWVVFRDTKSFLNLHARIRVGAFKGRGEDNLPTFPKDLLINYHNHDVRSQRDAQRIQHVSEHLTRYLLKLIRVSLFGVRANRLCRFFEISAMSISLINEGGITGKQGYLRMHGSSYGRPVSRPLKVVRPRRRRWFLVRESYLVAVSSESSNEIIEVFLFDSMLTIDRPKRLYKKPLALGSHAKTQNVTSSASESSSESDSDAEDKRKRLKAAEKLTQKQRMTAEGELVTKKNSSSHTIVLRNAERTLKLLATSETLIEQFEMSMRRMAADTMWTGKNRFDSFAPIRLNVSAKWLADGRDYYWLLSEAISRATKCIYIHDWWLSPELYLRRPPADNEEWRLDRLLQRKARDGVKIFVVVYREVSNDFTPVDSAYTKSVLRSLHPNIHVQRSPMHTPTGPLLWSHHEKMCVIDEMIGFMGGLDLCFGRWDTADHVLIDEGFPDGSPVKRSGSRRTDARRRSSVTLPRSLARLTSNASTLNIPIRGVPNIPLPGISSTMNDESAIDDEDDEDAGERGKHPLPPNIHPYSDIGQPPPDLRAHGGGAPPSEKADSNKTRPYDSDVSLPSAHYADAATTLGGFSTGVPPPGQIWPGKDYSNQRVLDFHTLTRPYEDMYDRKRVCRQPWHDVGLQLSGQPARDLCRHFVQRWNYLLRTMNHTVDMPFLLPAPDFKPSELVNLQLTGTLEAQICRSSGPWSLGLAETEHSIQNAYLKHIELSEHFIYIENQFFVSSTELEGSIVSNRIGDALVSRIIRARDEGTKWRAVILMPLIPGYPAPVDHTDASSVRMIMEFQFRSINRGENSVYARLRRAGINPTDYITFYGLRGWGQSSLGILMSECVYIHGKCMIVDDRVTLIGSANINDRSQRGDRDSELLCILRDTDMVDSFMGGAPYRVGRFNQALRIRLMREHLGVDVDYLDSKKYSTMMLTSRAGRVHTDEAASAEQSDTGVLESLSSLLDEAPPSGSESAETYITPLLRGILKSHASDDVSKTDEIVALLQHLPKVAVSTYLDRHPGLASILSLVSHRVQQRNPYMAGLPPAPDFAHSSFLDPASDNFYHGMWVAAAQRNTEIFRRVFKCMPDDQVQVWFQYREFQEYEARHQLLNEQQAVLPDYANNEKPPQSDTEGPFSAETKAKMIAALQELTGTLVEFPTRYLETESHGNNFLYAKDRLGPGAIYN